ncbi:MAG: Rne/Rng family ribonuclease [Alphaproteobacteria bacterium]|nr:Rne/Rng family ribonuclease [Alphaproteobacteria bacterium]
MAKRMLIDASQPEETRVVVLSGNALEDFDFEATAKKSLKGNIYLAKVVRVEPSLQAAFVDFGSSRHGFLSFNEIHPDYYRIPVADREALIAEEAQIASDAEAETSSKSSSNVAGKTSRKSKSPTKDDGAETNDGKESKSAEESTGEAAALNGGVKVETVAEAPASGADKKEKEKEEAEGSAADTNDNDVAAPDSENDKDEEFTDLETVGGDTDEDMAPKREPVTRRYKIQEVIKRGQILLVQVAKEERGTKGAALTTRISLAGRYCVLMPNVARGGGISRKIANPTDRRKLKAILDGLSIPEGVAVIVRTAGRERTKAEIKRDYEYLMRLWSDIRDATLQSSAPSLVYEEANIIKRAIRDLYSRDMDEVLVDSEDGYRLAKESMRMLTPSHAKRVKRYRDGDIPLFSRFEVDDQIDAIHNHSVRLKSGGYIVIDQTEALVSIDVNSGRSTRERNIEETALKTNLEAADEVARQLRLRDLAGLIVIDFIDMDEHRNRSKVEKRIKEALKTDRARIQIGRISGFGLLEMSRQRLRPSLHEISTQTCPHCGGRGVVRSIESTALHVLRAIEKEGSHNRNGQLSIHVPSEVDLYILNQKRDLLSAIEARHSLRVMIHHDASLVPPDFHIEGGAGGKAADDKTGKKEEKKSKSSSLHRRGRSRAKDAEETADEDSRKTSPVVDEPGDGDREDKPPRKRRRRGKRGGRRHSRKSAAKKTTAESTEMDSESKVSSATTEKAAKEESEKPAAKPRKKATRRTRKPAKSVAEKKAASSSGKDGDSKTPAKKKSTAAAPAAASDSDGSSAAKPAADNKPKRQGWWNALMD